MMYALALLIMFPIGSVTGVHFATVPIDWLTSDTYYVVAHFHFIMVGAVMMAFLAALHYWFPKMFGRKYPENWGLLAAGLIVLGLTPWLVPESRADLDHRHPAATPRGSR